MANIEKMGKNFYIGGVDPRSSTFTLPIDAVYLNSDTGEILKHLGKNEYKPILKQSVIDNIIEWTNSIYISIDDDYSAKEGQTILVDTTDKEITITLPKEPVKYSKVVIMDDKENFDTNKCTVAPGDDETVLGDEDGLELDVKNASVTLLYKNGDWRRING